MFNAEQKIANGLKILQSEVTKYTKSGNQKLQAMHETYFANTSVYYSPKEIEAAQYYLDALIHKFHTATLALEQLWALSYDKRDSLIQAIRLSLDKLEVTDDELALISFAFETFLFHARAYIDFYMLYICYVLRTSHEGSISRERFFKTVERVTEPHELAEKAKKVKKYFEQKVFGEYDGRAFEVTNWGTLITSLRDKVAHRDRIRPSFEGSETLLDQVLLDWPTIRGITYERFHQDMQNGMFILITEVSTILYDLEWKPGQYIPGMFNQ